MKTLNGLFSKAILLSLLCLGLNSIYLQARENKKIYYYSPTVTALSPNYGPETGGSVITIEGTYFHDALTVQFGKESAASFVVVSDKIIAAVAPEGTGTIDVTVTTPEGGTSEISPAGQFKYMNSDL